MNTPSSETAVGPFLRTTVLTETRAVDVVLPTDQPVAGLVPALVDLLEMPAGGWGHHLIRPDGSALAAESTLEHVGVTDGVQLRLVGADQAPPNPVVYDLVDVVEEDRPRTVWNSTTREVGLSVVAASLLAAAAALSVIIDRLELATALLALGGVALAACVVAKLLDRTAIAWVWFGLAWAALTGGGLLGDHWPAWLTVVLAIPLLLLTIGLCTDRTRAVLTALAAWAVLVATAAVFLWLTDHDRGLTALVVAAVAGLLIGLAPRFALASTGAYGVDSRLGRGEEVRVHSVRSVVADAHFSLVATVLVVALTGGIALYLAARQRPTDIWTVVFVAVATVSWLVRVRHFPLVVERLALWAAALLGLCGLAGATALRYPEAGWAVVALALLATVAVIGLSLREPAELLAANVRRWAARVETLTIVAVIPLIVGAFGVYSDLLDTF